MDQIEVEGAGVWTENSVSLGKEEAFRERLELRYLTEAKVVLPRNNKS